MSQVWTRKRAGTDSTPRSKSFSTAAVVRNPVSNRPQIHQIELPLSWAEESKLPGSVPEWTEVYLIDGDPLTLIDTGVCSAASRATLETAFEALGHGLADVGRVVLTHAHRDHFGLVESLRACGAELECCVHEADAEGVERFSDLVRDRLDGMKPLFREFGVPESVLARLYAARLRGLAVEDAEGERTSVDRRLVEGDRIEWKDWGLTVMHSPGHTSGHILLEDAEAGLLFTGDQIMGQAVPHAENFYLDETVDPKDPLRRRPRFRGLVEMRRSLRRLRGRRDKLLLPGYGGVIRRPDRSIRDTLLYYDVRIHRIDRGLRHLAVMGQDVTAYELWKALFLPGIPIDGAGDEHLEAMHSQLLLVIGALDCLEEDDLLVTERRPDGVFTHHHR